MVQKRTSKGQIIDFDKLRSSTDTSRPAIGNMGTDGKGNKLGKGGKVVMTNEERVRKYYAETTVAVDERKSIKGDAVQADDSMKPTAEPKTAKTAKENKRTAKAPAPIVEPDEFDAPEGVEPLGYKEVEMPNGDIEMVPFYKDEDA